MGKNFKRVIWIESNDFFRFIFIYFLSVIVSLTRVPLIPIVLRCNDGQTKGVSSVVLNSKTCVPTITAKWHPLSFVSLSFNITYCFIFCIYFSVFPGCFSSFFCQFWCSFSSVCLSICFYISVLISFSILFVSCMYVSSLCLFVDLFQSLSQSFCLSLKPMYTHIHMFKCESTLNEEEKSSVRPCVRPYGQAVSLRWWPSDVFLFFIFYQIFWSNCRNWNARTSKSIYGGKTKIKIASAIFIFCAIFFLIDFLESKR